MLLTEAQDVIIGLYISTSNAVQKERKPLFKYMGI